MPTTAQMLTRENFASLLTPIHKKIFFDSYGEVESKYSKIFKVSDKVRTYMEVLL